MEFAETFKLLSTVASLFFTGGLFLAVFGFELIAVLEFFERRNLGRRSLTIGSPDSLPIKIFNNIDKVAFT